MQLQWFQGRGKRLCVALMITVSLLAWLKSRDILSVDKVFTKALADFVIYNKSSTLIESDLRIHLASSNDLLVVYNRVPKCGSTTIKALLRRLARRNRFKFITSIIYDEMKLPVQHQLDLARGLNNITKPVVFDRHLYFIDFSRFESSPPVYFNLIRDPIERLRSEYYYRVQRHPEMIPSKNQTYDECILHSLNKCNSSADFFILVPYFCGQDDFCTEPSKSSLAKAKNNVINKYLLVGITEEIDRFIEGIELMLPQIFAGAKEEFSKKNFEPKNVTKDKKNLTETTLAFLQNKLKEEYDFYYFAKQYFHQKMDHLKVRK